MFRKTKFLPSHVIFQRIFKVGQSGMVGSGSPMGQAGPMQNSQQLAQNIAMHTMNQQTQGTMAMQQIQQVQGYAALYVVNGENRKCPRCVNYVALTFA